MPNLKARSLLLALSLVGCAQQTDRPADDAAPAVSQPATATPVAAAPALPAPPPPTITLATSPVPHESGLLDELLPIFEQESGFKVQVLALTSEQALELGRRGEADLLLMQSPAAEQQFIAAGLGGDRLPVMQSEFVLVGPPADPAKVKELKEVADAFWAIAAGAHSFVSHTAGSEAQVLERAIWKSAQTEPQGAWYLQDDSDTAHALRLAHEKGAYTLVDLATYQQLQPELSSVILLAGEGELLNRYSLLTVRQPQRPAPHHQAISACAQFLTSPATRARIAQFRTPQHTQALFLPATNQ